LSASHSFAQHINEVELMNTTQTMQLSAQTTQSAITNNLRSYVTGLGFATVFFVAPFALAVMIAARVMPASFGDFSMLAAWVGLGAAAFGGARLLEKRDESISWRLATESVVISLILGVLVGIAQI
jgi:hypothetical protein